jgi:putative endonuclease
MTNQTNKVLYIGITNNLRVRVYQHKNKLFEGFTKKYNCIKIVYFETYGDIRLAILREKELKKWRREKKNRLVNMSNPEWKDLANDFDK